MCFFNFWGGYPPGGGHGSTPANFGSWYENISQNQCPCRKSAFYLIRCGHAPLKKNSYKKNDFPVIFRSFSAADGQMSGQMSIQLTYLNRAFYGLSIDMSHDPKHIFSIFGWLPPPGGVQDAPLKNFFRSWKDRSKPLSMPKFGFLSKLVLTLLPHLWTLDLWVWLPPLVETYSITKMSIFPASGLVRKIFNSKNGEFHICTITFIYSCYFLHLLKNKAIKKWI